jgi:hypothetical protein
MILSVPQFRLFQLTDVLTTTKMLNHRAVVYFLCVDVYVGKAVFAT